MGRYWKNKLTLGSQLTLTFALLVALILGGGGLLSWQFRIARQQTDRLAVVSGQMMAVLRLQYALLSFHQGLNELVELKDAEALADRSKQLQEALLEQFQGTRRTLSRSPSDRRLEMRFLAVLDSIEIGFPHQLEAISSLAAAGDWEAVKHRVADQLKPTEIEITAIANQIDASYTAELALTEQNTNRLQNRIMFLIALIALLTFSVATLLVWAIARRILGLRIEERLSERMRISRDLHDTLLQTLQGSKLLAETTAEKCSDPVEMRQAVEQIASWLGRATEEGRSALNSLNATPADPNDFAEAFRAIAADARTQCSMRIDLSVSGNPVDLPPGVQNEVVQIAREALTNARKHSQGRRAEVQLEYADEFCLTISDDGKGFDPTKNADALNGHYGLRGMRERAAHIGGNLTISSSGTGTRVRLILPKRNFARAFRGFSSKPAGSLR